MLLCSYRSCRCWTEVYTFLFLGLYLIERTYSLLGFPSGSAGKESACCTVDLGLIPGLGSYPGDGKAHPVQYSGLENSMGCAVQGIAKSQTRLSEFHCLGKFQVRTLCVSYETQGFIRTLTEFSKQQAPFWVLTVLSDSFS